jgi:hypothetical protein
MREAHIKSFTSSQTLSILQRLISPRYYNESPFPWRNVCQILLEDSLFRLWGYYIAIRALRGLRQGEGTWPQGSRTYERVYRQTIRCEMW